MTSQESMPVLPFQIQAQYMKDLSFESPNPLAYFTSETPQTPDIGVNVNVNVEPVGEKAFEVCLQVNVDAKIKESNVFLIELQYCGLFTVSEELSKEEIKPLLLIEAPRYLFPFARQVISDTTSRGGFPPLSLAPIDFAALYRQQQDAAAESAHAAQNQSVN